MFTSSDLLVIGKREPIDKTQQSKNVRYSPDHRKQMNVSSQPQFSSAWRQKHRVTVSAVKQESVSKDCEASFHLPSWTSGAVHGAEEASLTHCLLLCPFEGALAALTLQRCCSKSRGGFSSGHCHWQGSSNRM